MKWIEYAIAREVGRLMAEAGQRELTEKEWFLLDLFTPHYLRLEEADLQPQGRRSA